MNTPPREFVLLSVVKDLALPFEILRRLRLLRMTHSGFTLIELSMVLVVIGLVVGGVLAGQDLIRAAAMRAQITQIEKFNSATNTFYGKFGYLPGDIPAAPAAQFGFAARGAFPGQGDGNGILQGTSPAANYIDGDVEASGEAITFWNDLATANLIEGAYSGQPTTATALSVPATGLSRYLPLAKIGQGNFVYAYSTTAGSQGTAVYNMNFFGLSAVADIGLSSNYRVTSFPALSVQQAYAIDRKIDDGLPLTGNVMAFYLSGTLNAGNPVYANGNGSLFEVCGCVVGYGISIWLFPLPASSTSCFDNGGNASNPAQYSVTTNNGSGVNCAVSFVMQGAGR